MASSSLLTNNNNSNSIHNNQNGAVDTMLSKFQLQMRRLDELEDKINARTVRTRRRVAAVLDQVQSDQRSSHVRFWISHSKTEPTSTAEESATSTADTSMETNEPPVPLVNTTAASASLSTTMPTFKLQLEGCMLIGNLDHASAHDFDKQAKFQPSQDELDRARGGDREDDVPVPAYRLTHLFRKLQVDFQTVYYQPASSANSKRTPTATKKSSRRDSGISPKKKKAKKNAAGGGASDKAHQVNLQNCILSDPYRLVWTPELSTDAHGWSLHYTPLEKPGWRVHSVNAKIALYPLATASSSSNQQRFQRYSIRHPRLVKAIFPHHGAVLDEEEQQKQQEELQEQRATATAATASSSASKKRKSIDTNWTTADGKPFPPLDNDLHAQPATLTMSEIIMAFFTYLRDKKLMANEPQDKTSILCDDLLQEVLGMERMPFSQLQRTLLQRNAIVRVTEPPPVKVTYVMHSVPDEDGAEESPLLPPPWQWDMECSIPHLYPFRTRELLRRVKRRELEYTSSRTRARYLLSATVRQNHSTEEVRHFVESAVQAEPHTVPQIVWQALAKGAPPQTEARRAAQLEAQWAYLLQDALPVSLRGAMQSDELVDLSVLESL